MNAAHSPAAARHRVDPASRSTGARTDDSPATEVLTGRRAAVVVDVEVDVDLDGGVYVEVGDLALTGRPSTPRADVQADVHVHDNDYVYVNLGERR